MVSVFKVGQGKKKIIFVIFVRFHVFFFGGGVNMFAFFFTKFFENASKKS